MRKPRCCLLKKPSVCVFPLEAIPRLAVFALIESLDKPVEFRLQEKPPLTTAPPFLFSLGSDYETSATCPSARRE